MKACIEQIFNGNIAVSSSYSSNSITVGNTALINQYNLNEDPVNTFLGPFASLVGRPLETGLLRAINGVHPVQAGADRWWVFGIDAATAASTRQIQRWDYIPSTNTFTYVGAITVTPPTATNHTQRGLRVVLENYTTGTASVSGTTVTGTSTAWQASRLSVGSRIGFGNTNPDQISTWYEISAITSDTEITLTGSAGTVTDGAYVIQDMILVMATTNATTTNGGLFVVKGLRPELFTQPSATVISAATTTDRVRAVYWLKDAATITNTVSGGCALEDRISWTEQYVYCCDGAATSLKVYKYNIRAALSSLSTGAQVLTSGTDVIVTGAQTVTGNISQLNNGRIATLAHGPGNGIPSLYLLTTTRIVRIPTSNITTGSTTYVGDQMAEVPPGSTTTNLAIGTFISFDVSPSMDRLVITGPVATGTHYMTQYLTDGSQFERRFGATIAQTDSGTAQAGVYQYPHTTTATMAVWVESGIAFFTTISATASLHAIYVYPLGADWEYIATTNNRAILPKITLGNTASKLYRVMVNNASLLGNSLLGMSTDSWRLKYRTSGIDDNTGAWTTLNQNGDLSGIAAPTEIQFCIEFRTAGLIQIPTRIYSLALIYETNDGLPSQYRWNFGDFDSNDGTFAWIQTSLFGTAIGIHTINIYRSDTNALVLTQDSNSTTNGNFQYWNGSSWVNGLGTDTLTLRRRFLPTGSLPSGVDLYATLVIA